MRMYISVPLHMTYFRYVTSGLHRGTCLDLWPRLLYFGFLPNFRAMTLAKGVQHQSENGRAANLVEISRACTYGIK